MRKMILTACLGALMLPAAPALADPPPWAPAHGRRAKERVYDDYGRYYEPRRLSRDDRIWRGRDGRYYCKRSDGTVGLVVAVVEGVGCGEETRDAQPGGEPFGGDGSLQLRPGLDACGDERLALNIEDGSDAERQHGLRLANPEFALHFPAPVTVIWHSRSTLRMELRVSHRP